MSGYWFISAVYGNGQDVHFIGGDLYTAVNAGVAKGYTKGYLRKSSVGDPVFDRKNSGDNTPAVIHTKIIPGDKVKLIVLPKGCGSENMGAVKMLKPADGVEGIKKFVVDTVRLCQDQSLSSYYCWCRYRWYYGKGNIVI